MKIKYTTLFTALACFSLQGQTIEESVQKLDENATALEDIVNGPAEGAGSIVTLPNGGTQITVSKAINDIQSNLTQAIVSASTESLPTLDTSPYVEDDVILLANGEFYKYRPNDGTGDIPAFGGGFWIFQKKSIENKICIILPLGGQSNMQGGLFSGAVDSFENYPLKNLLQLSRGRDRGYIEPVGANGDVIPAYNALQHNNVESSQYNSLGFELGQLVARNYPNCDILLVPFATGNTGFTDGAAGWAPGGAQRLDSVSRLTMAASYATANYSLVHCPIFAWHQGENDVNNTNDGYDYSGGLLTLTNEWRALSSIYTNTALISGDVNTNSGQFNAIMRRHNLIDPNSSHTTTYGQEYVTTDNVHYNESSVRIMAKNYFDKFEEKLKDALTHETYPDFTPSLAGFTRNYNFNDLTDSSGNGADLTALRTKLPVLAGGLAGFYNSPLLSDITVTNQSNVYGYMFAVRFRQKPSSQFTTYLDLSNSVGLFYATSSGVLRFQGNEVGIVDILPGVDMRDGEWRTIVITNSHDNSGPNERLFKVFMNGETIYSSIGSFGANILTTSAAIGGRYNNNDIECSGQISNLIFYDGLYTEAQGQALSLEMKNFFND